MKSFAAVGLLAGALSSISAAALPLFRSPAAARAEQQSGGGVPAPSALKPADLDRILAPIALYPDQLLAQMLLCATKPAKLAALNEWMAANPTLHGSDLQDAASKSGFDQSFAAMVLFPDVVQAMAADLERTTQVGQAFAADRSAVFASIQRLRAKASQAGKLKTTPQQQVETRTTSGGEQVIVIEPANPQVIYVPQYNPQTVYTTSTVVIQENDNDAAVAAGLIGFTAGIALGAAIDNDYYYGPYGWYGGAYMYNDAWDDYYDAREDARDDWQDHREDMLDERGDRREDIADERGDRAGSTQQSAERQQSRTETRAQGEQRRTDAGAAATTTRSTSQESRGYSDGKTARERSGTGSDAFSGYSSGRSQKSASSRGQRSRSSSGGGGRRR